MKQSLFEHEMRKAQAFARLGERSDYWMGYQRGLRRRYHGDNFGDPGEHELWLTASGDHHRDERRAGYHDGYFGPDAAPKTIRAWRDWTVKDLASRIGRSPRTVQGWEQGREIPPAAQGTLDLLRISD